MTQVNKQCIKETDQVAMRLLDLLYSDHQGVENGISVEKLAIKFLLSDEGAVPERSIRHAIKDLRLEGVAVCAHPSEGYYLAKNSAELEKTCNFLFSRAISSLVQIAKMKKVNIPDLAGQLSLDEAMVQGMVAMHSQPLDKNLTGQMKRRKKVVNINTKTVSAA